MAERIEEFTVVGGGTAGWVAAMSLSTFINRYRQGPPVRVTLIESPNIPTIGVGEATVIGMTRLLSQIGVNETEFFRRCNASFKLSVRFSGWSNGADGQPQTFYHPFNNPPMLEGQVPAYHYRKFGGGPGTVDFADAMGVNAALCRARKGPRRIGTGDFDGAIGYAYHLDAGLFTQFLREQAAARGIRHVLDDIVDVKLDERGFVEALELERGGLHPVEFVVDCSGFRSLIMQKALGEPFVPFGDHLLCDRAIPLQLPHGDPTKLEPCTRSTALGAGWVWRVPLYSRVGTGYVYSSKFRSEDEARAEFFAHLRANGDLPADAPDPDTRVIKMRIGRTRRSWVKNCVAIGLSGGFIEPLESTAIFMIDAATRWFVSYLPDREVSPALARQFNGLMQGLYEEVRDFIVSHYLTSNRDDPFWRAARSDIVVPGDLREKLDLWQNTMPCLLDTREANLFGYWNYIYCLWPKGYFDAGHYPLESALSQERWAAFSQQLGGLKDQLLGALPNHYDLVRHIRGEDAEENPAAAFGGKAPALDFGATG